MKPAISIFFQIDSSNFIITLLYVWKGGYNYLALKGKSADITNFLEKTETPRYFTGLEVGGVQFARND